MDAGKAAFDKGQYAEAEKQWVSALKEARKRGEQDLHLGATLNSLALLYHAQGKHVEAGPLYQRALAIYEKALGPEQPNACSTNG